MKLYHGTSMENKLKIIEKGFKSGYGEFGTGVYFATTRDIAWDYGDEIIEVFVDDEHIKKMSLEEIDSIKTKMLCFCLGDYFYNFNRENPVDSIMVDIDCKMGQEVCVYNEGIIEIIQR